MTKVYTTKSNAIRAAKKASDELTTYEIEQVEGGWVYHLFAAEDEDLAAFEAADDIDFDEIEATDDLMDGIHIEDELAPIEPVKSKSGYIRGSSVIEGPCATVHAIADEMLAEHGKVSRKDVMDAAQAAGVTYGTARTQYQKWYEKNK